MLGWTKPKLGLFVIVLLLCFFYTLLVHKMTKITLILNKNSELSSSDQILVVQNLEMVRKIAGIRFCENVDGEILILK